MEKWLSVAELAKQADVPESTTRRYLTKFEAFFRYEDRARGRRYDPQSVAIIALIQSLYSENRLEAEEIIQVLQKQFPFTVPTDEPPTTTTPSSPTFATKSDLEAVMNEVRGLHGEMAALREENVQLHKILDERMVERDKRLMEAMQTVLETRKEIAAAQEEQVKKKWWKFW